MSAFRSAVLVDVGFGALSAVSADHRISTVNAVNGRFGFPSARVP